ncbi:cerebellar degeneration-related protein 2 isoform X2 [Gouania willdenowi]|uniref:cerebellar degeneration-related protein 2 isoform X2 n=1 Tax=Gouania willdenowi TaxID=441366 RepID=UPI001056284D|nr:cerebellar degeneration-related protein 2-like isoform X2 [Gouania willdenowi]
MPRCCRQQTIHTVLWRGCGSHYYTLLTEQDSGGVCSVPGVEMLAGVILEEEFEKNGEVWYEQHDLEHDLRLAAELGKSLLSKNHDLEQALQQMYSTNQEQLQEIEYLTRQMDLLRHMNDHHAKVYEQLDISTRDLEHSNKTLLQENRLAQQKIHSLTQIIEGLQTQTEDLQTQVSQFKAEKEKHNNSEQTERCSLGARSVSCLKELNDLHNSRYPTHITDGLWSPRSSLSNKHTDPQEENQALHRSIQTLQSQISAERSHRLAAQREIELTVSENRSLEERLALLTGCRARQQELEDEVEQLRLLWRADCAKRPTQLLLPDTVFFAAEESAVPSLTEQQEKVENVEEPRRTHVRPRSNSDGSLRTTSPEEISLVHDQLCIRRTEAVKQRGVSLLNEVDAQYSALQVKYEALLQRCQQATDGLSHKSVQTSSSPCVSTRNHQQPSSSAGSSVSTWLQEDAQLPEYKSLFKEIFTRLQKTKEDLSENRRSHWDAIFPCSAK